VHPAFAAFCKDWGVGVAACRPYRARTKGKTESGVGYVKRNAIAGLAFTSFAALEAHLARWMTEADQRVHGTTHERPIDRGRHSVLFVTATSLLAQLSRAQVEGKLADQIAFYAKPKLLVIDELGYLPLEKQTAHLFFQLVSRRYERGSMLITTNQTITQWGHVFGDEMIAAAVLDRVLHHSHVLVIQGDSFRLRQKKRAGLLGSTKPNN
jgi:hypothetical protein